MYLSIKIGMRNFEFMSVGESSDFNIRRLLIDGQLQSPKLSNPKYREISHVLAPILDLSSFANYNIISAYDKPSALVTEKLPIKLQVTKNTSPIKKTDGAIDQFQSEITQYEDPDVRETTSSEPKGTTDGTQQIPDPHPESSLEYEEDKSKCICRFINMINENKLTLVHTSAILSEFERLFASNLIYIRSQKRVDYTMDTAKFVEHVNAILSDKGCRRNDDQLRFIYKRAIKSLMEKRTDYNRNSKIGMTAYEKDFVNAYFPNNPEVTNILTDTTFASKKKLQQLFRLSPGFQEDFMEFVTCQILTEYTRHTWKMYGMFYEKLKKMLRDNSEKNEKMLHKEFKRLPWGAMDITATISRLKKFFGNNQTKSGHAGRLNVKIEAQEELHVTDDSPLDDLPHQAATL